MKHYKAGRVVFLHTGEHECRAVVPNVFVTHGLVTGNVPSKSLLSVRRMEGCVSSNLKGGACFRLKARI